MAKRPRNKKVDRSIIEQGGSTPIRALAVALDNKRYKKEDRKYQNALKEMGVFDNAGGRGREEFRGRAQRMKYGGKVRAMQNGGAVMNGRGPKFKGQS